MQATAHGTCESTQVRNPTHAPLVAKVSQTPATTSITAESTQERNHTSVITVQNGLRSPVLRPRIQGRIQGKDPTNVISAIRASPWHTVLPGRCRTRTVHQIEYPLGGSSNKGSHVYSLLHVFG